MKDWTAIELYFWEPGGGYKAARLPLLYSAVLGFECLRRCFEDGVEAEELSQILKAAHTEICKGRALPHNEPDWNRSRAEAIERGIEGAEALPVFEGGRVV